MTLDQDLVSRFAPTGRLRASINLGNPVLAQRDGDAGEASGVSVDLARAFAERLGVALQLKVFDVARASVAAIEAADADIGFFAIDPERGVDIAFTAAYVHIEGAYVVRRDSPIRSNADVDQAGHRVVVGKGSAYDLFLTRELRNALVERAPTSQLVIDTFVAQEAEVAAGVRQQLQSDARRVDGLRLLEGRFMVIEQAMGIARSRGDLAHQVLSRFIEDMKTSGFVADALRRHGIHGASVAPAA